MGSLDHGGGGDDAGVRVPASGRHGVAVRRHRSVVVVALGGSRSLSLHMPHIRLHVHGVDDCESSKVMPGDVGDEGKLCLGGHRCNFQNRTGKRPTWSQRNEMSLLLPSRW